ncbi:hypothetical protein BDV12DRAFT_194279 [Aspergillus spectabilis]
MPGNMAQETAPSCATSFAQSPFNTLPGALQRKDKKQYLDEDQDSAVGKHSIASTITEYASHASDSRSATDPGYGSLGSYHSPRVLDQDPRFSSRSSYFGSATRSGYEDSSPYDSSGPLYVNQLEPRGPNYLSGLSSYDAGSAFAHGAIGPGPSSTEGMWNTTHSTSTGIQASPILSNSEATLEMPKMRASAKNSYIAMLAKEIHDSITGYQVSDDDVRRICSILPDLLGGLGLSIGHLLSWPVQSRRDVMFFICRNCREITSCFRQMVLNKRSVLENRNSFAQITVGEKMQNWFDVEERVEASRRQQQHEGCQSTTKEADDESYTDHTPEGTYLSIESYKELFQAAAAYEKLLEDVRRECTLEFPNPNLLSEVRETIFRGLPAPCDGTNSQTPPEQHHNVIFKVDWDPVTFIQMQNFAEIPEVAIRQTVVLTGTTTKAQAVTCARYLEQTWPITGLDILGLIQRICQNPFTSTVSRTLRDRTIVTGRRWCNRTEERPHLHITVNGLAIWIVEIGEILSWMGSSLRSSPYDNTIAYTKPHVGWSLDANDPHDEKECNMTFVTIQKESEKPNDNGRCWYNLFRNAVVVEGFPFAQRPFPITGLEISLAMMARLCQTNNVNPFRNSVYIKGFSTLLVPTSHSGSVITWHLLFDPAGGRISYNEADLSHTAEVTISDLQRSRHILGWCSEMKLFAGSNDANYDIKHSRLSGVPRTSMFWNTFISMGQVVTGGTAFSVGEKDIPIHVTRHGYAKRLKWIAKRFVLLWDEEDKRGWLLNGTTALLHLVLASLKKEKESQLSALNLFDPESIIHKHTHRPESAGWVLSSTNNLHLTVYAEDGVETRFQDQVTNFYEIMEKMIDHQSRLLSKSTISTGARSWLEGWDFDDVAAERDPIYPRATALDTEGRSWVDLIRSIQGITLFGRGFGEIIQAVNSCTEWETVPRGRSYLAVCAADIQEIIMAGRGNPLSTPARMTENILWYVPKGFSCTCECLGGGGKSHSDPVQVLLPSSMASQWPSICTSPRYVGVDAFIFGQNALYPWYWPDTGEPSSKPPLGHLTVKQGGFPTSLESGIRTSSCSPAVSDSDYPSTSRKRSCITVSSQSSESIFTNLSHSSESSIGLTSTDYTIGIICALHQELKALRILFDATTTGISISKHDQNCYVFGIMARHNIVATCLPDGEYGTNAAADVASNMKRSFPYLRLCLLVGIGGGVPLRNDIRLGDVVVSKRHDTNSGTLQYDMTKALEKGKIELNGSLDSAPRWVRSVLSEMQSDPCLQKAPLENSLRQIQESDPAYRHPGTLNDKLYKSSYSHPNDEDTCHDCKSNYEQPRPARDSTQPFIYYGTIASGNQVMKDAATRDKWGKEYNVLCFEMEAAGIVNILPSLIIRGICDYCDTHKNDLWQKYAAASAAAFAKLLLSRIRPESDSREDSSSPETGPGFSTDRASAEPALPGKRRRV